MYDQDIEDYNDELRKEKKAERHNNPKRKDPIIFKLGQEIANGVKYWGQDITIKHNRTCMCICPYCNNAWRVNLQNILHGITKSCCRQG